MSRTLFVFDSETGKYGIAQGGFQNLQLAVCLLLLGLCLLLLLGLGERLAYTLKAKLQFAGGQTQSRQ
jgi:hypothetical protein